MDAHLYAEYREIRHVPAALARSLKSRGIQGVLKAIPKQFTLNTGHVMFWYDKSVFLHKRFNALRAELLKRNYNIPDDVVLDKDNIFGQYAALQNDYVPTEAALATSRQRIAEKVALKPSWYRFYGRPLENTQ
jgi:deoxyribonuclease (pyrimidine dimer)